MSIKEKTTWYKKLGKWSNSWPGTIVIVLAITMFLAQNFIIPSGSMIKTLLIGDMLFVKKFAYGIPTPHLPWVETSLIPGTDLINNPASGHIVNGDKPQRGDIVVFRYPLNPKVHYIKRCTATPGDELFLYQKDLYLHPAEGDDFIKEHYPQDSIIALSGKLWVKKPYMLDHKGVHHDDAEFPDKESPIYVGNPQIYSLNNQLWQDAKEFAHSLNGKKYAYAIRKEEFILFYSTLEQLSKDPVTVPENEYFMMGDNRDHSNDSRAWGSVPYGLIEGTPWFVYFSIADDYSIRWDRVGKSIADLEEMVK